MKNKQNIMGYEGSLNLPGGRVGILLIHSLGGNPIELRFVAQGLAREGYTVHCPILPGLSGGTDVSSLSSWKDWYAAAAEAHDELCKQCDVVLVGGLSAGSIVALRLAAMRPERVQGLMVFAPTLWPNGWAIPWTLQLFKLIRSAFAASLFKFRMRAPYGIKDERIRSFMMDALEREEGRSADELFSRNGRVVLQFRRLVKDVLKRMKTIDQPAIIFHPRHDDQSALRNATKIQHRLTGPVEMHVLDDTYHMVTLDRQRHIVVERSLDFVARLMNRIGTSQQVPSLARGGAAGE